MTHQDGFARICDIPAVFRRGERSVHEVVRASGYPDFRGRFAARELADYLRAHPEVIESWVAYSQDKRTSEGWYLRPPYSIGRVTRAPPPMREVQHVDLGAACAAFIIAELDDILDRAPAV